MQLPLLVHTLKLSDSDDGVAFFAGIAPDAALNGYAELYGYYAGILLDPDLGAPITETSGNSHVARDILCYYFFYIQF